ncbi:MAG: hypothetical protein ACK41V_15070 [Acidovorax sp.]|uniref:hypothetical protein n=1 Tax=Acidovorax sp. TaxID=1872122 RepID=UPI0039191154
MVGVKAQVHNISKLKDYYFLVPDYQREYVWKADDPPAVTGTGWLRVAKMDWA